MKEKVKGLYILKHFSTLDKKVTTIKFVDNDGKLKEKMTLTDIDSFTTQFDSAQSLLFYLQDIGYNFYNSNFFIEYQNNHQAKRLDLVFSDQHTINNFAVNNQKRYKVEKDSSFYQYLYKIVDEVANDQEMIYYLRKNNYISMWLYENLAEYKACQSIDVESSHIYMTRIKTELSKYKIIRNIEIGIKEYESEKLFKQQIEERKKTFVKKKIKNQKNFIEGQEQLFNPDNY